MERLQNIVLSKMGSLKSFLSDYTESADFKQKEEAIMLQIHCCNGKVNMINLNTKCKHGETAKHCAFKDGQFNIIP